MCNIDLSELFLKKITITQEEENNSIDEDYSIYSFSSKIDTIRNNFILITSNKENFLLIKFDETYPFILSDKSDNIVFYNNEKFININISMQGRLLNTFEDTFSTSYDWQKEDNDELLEILLSFLENNG